MTQVEVDEVQSAMDVQVGKLEGLAAENPDAPATDPGTTEPGPAESTTSSEPRGRR